MQNVAKRFIKTHFDLCAAILLYTKKICNINKYQMFYCSQDLSEGVFIN